jgi:hypothetical protein
MHLEKRQTILLVVGVALILAVLVWKFVLVGGEDDVTVEPTTVTTVATAEVPVDPSAPVVDPSAPAPGAEAPAAEAPTAPAPFNPSAYRDPFLRQG